MADAETVLTDLLSEVGKLRDGLNSRRRLIAASAWIQPRVREMASGYFESVRPQLRHSGSRTGLVDELDKVMHRLIELASETREDKAVYGEPLEALRVLLLEATVDFMKARGNTEMLLSQTERAIMQTLDRMLPNTARSYQQALRDIAEGGRVSWRGTAAELRDVLREVIDHLAPDDKVMAAAGFQLENDQKSPTQKQKVRFILRARRTGSAAIETAEATLRTADESVASLARTAYTRGSASAHAAPKPTEIRNLKRYIDALLGELLEVAS